MARVSDVPLYDYGFSLKVDRREVPQGFRLYSEMHRFTPIYARGRGCPRP
jgi:dolichol-phosphate mannosyltransferase